MEKQRVIDKSKWPAGPWTDEPDRVEWRDEATGLPCLIVRHPGCGHLCGYVAVPPGHPYHGKTDGMRIDGKDRDEDYGDYDMTLGAAIRCHGGVTYTEFCAHDVCHVPAEGEPDNVWWIGFDMAHSGDLTPLDAKYESRYPRMRPGTYRTVDYVRAECTSVAAQLARAAR